MTYHFRIISNEVEDFIFEILIDSNAFFVDFHSFIQKELNFDKSQMASFFITDDEWNKEIEITLLDMMSGEVEQFVMDKVRLEELISNTRQRLLYVFDMFADRVLFLELIDIKNTGIESPKCVRLKGEPPISFSENFDMEFNEIIDEESFDDSFDDNSDDILDFPIEQDEDFY